MLVRSSSEVVLSGLGGESVWGLKKSNGISSLEVVGWGLVGVGSSGLGSGFWGICRARAD